MAFGAIMGQTPDLTDFVKKTGDTLTGPLLYDGVPSVGTELVNKDYVDNNFSFDKSFDIQYNVKSSIGIVERTITFTKIFEKNYLLLNRTQYTFSQLEDIALPATPKSGTLFFEFYSLEGNFVGGTSSAKTTTFKSYQNLPNQVSSLQQIKGISMLGGSNSAGPSIENIGLYIKNAVPTVQINFQLYQNTNNLFFVKIYHSDEYIQEFS